MEAESVEDGFGRNVIDFTSVPANQRTGRGVVLFDDGSVYSGDWRNGQMHGHGAHFLSSGDIYLGDFDSGERQGSGLLLTTSGDLYVGTFRKELLWNGTYSRESHERVERWRGGAVASVTTNRAPQRLRIAYTEFFSEILDQIHRCVQGPPRQVEVPALAVWKCPHVSSQASSPRPVFTGQGADPTPPSRVPGSSCGPLPLHLAGSPGASSPGTVSQELSHRNERHEPFTAASGDYYSFESGSAAESLEGQSKPLHRPACPETLAAVMTPFDSERFSFWRFLRRLLVFLFPFLSCPWGPFAPLRVTTLTQEREYVVSGATLRRDFKPPQMSLVCNAAGVACMIAAVVIAWARTSVGDARDGRLTLAEVVVPCVLWVVTAIVCAVYHSARRVAHPLERLDRVLCAELAAAVASVVDARAGVCVHTQSEDGRSGITNKHYSYRWAFFAATFAAMMAFAAPATRAGYHRSRIFGEPGFEMAATFLSFFSTFFFAATLMYYVLKFTDMRREVLAKMRVLTDIAFLERRSLMNPTSIIDQPFHIDEPLDLTNLFTGFQGWYATRTMTLYSNSGMNHNACNASMSFFMLTVFMACVVAIVDVFYMVAQHDTRSGLYYSTAHSYGVVVFTVWGGLVARYTVVSLAVGHEQAQHGQIMRTAALYHLVQSGDTKAGTIIQQYGSLSDLNSVRPRFFLAPMHPLLVVLQHVVIAGALAAIGVQLAQVIQY